MKLKGKSKSRKMRGTRTMGYAMKKHKGSGNRGGKGMAGTGKRADHKKTWVIKNRFPYFGKRGFTSKSTAKKKVNVINFEQIQNNYKPGQINLDKYKILGNGEIKDKFIIKAKAASTSALAKVEKAGGKIEIEKKIGNAKQKKQTEKPNEEAGKKQELTKKSEKDKKLIKQELPDKENKKE